MKPEGSETWVIEPVRMVCVSEQTRDLTFVIYFGFGFLFAFFLRWAIRKLFAWWMLRRARKNRRLH